MGRMVSHFTQHWDETASGPAYRVIDPWGPRFLPVMPFFFARALLQILWLALRGRITLLHVHMASWGSVLRKGVIVRLASLLGIPVVLHLHAGDFLTFYERLPPLGKLWTLGVLRRADRLVVLSEGWRKALADWPEARPGALGHAAERRAGAARGCPEPPARSAGGGALPHPLPGALGSRQGRAGVDCGAGRPAPRRPGLASQPGRRRRDRGLPPAGGTKRDRRPAGVPRLAGQCVGAAASGRIGYLRPALPFRGPLHSPPGGPGVRLGGGGNPGRGGGGNCRGRRFGASNRCGGS